MKFYVIQDKKTGKYLQRGDETKLEIFKKSLANARVHNVMELPLEVNVLKGERAVEVVQTWRRVGK